MQGEGEEVKEGRERRGMEETERGGKRGGMASNLMEGTWMSDLVGMTKQSVDILFIYLR